jgi:hypothetical protein
MATTREAWKEDEKGQSRFREQKNTPPKRDRRRSVFFKDETKRNALLVVDWLLLCQTRRKKVKKAKVSSPRIQGNEAGSARIRLLGS